MEVLCLSLNSISFVKKRLPQLIPEGLRNRYMRKCCKTIFVESGAEYDLLSNFVNSVISGITTRLLSDMQKKTYKYYHQLIFATENFSKIAFDA